MSTWIVTNIQGTGTFAVPETDAEMTAISSALATILSGVSGLTYFSVKGVVNTSEGSGPVRQLDALVFASTDNNAEVLDQPDTSAMATAIKNAIEADPGVTSVDSVNAELFEESTNYLWEPGASYATPQNAADSLGPGLVDGGLAIVHVGAIPPVFTILNLTGFIGARVAQVWLKVTNVSPGTVVAFRTPGDVNDYSVVGEYNVQYMHNIVPGESSSLCVKTDGAGRIQHKGSGSASYYLQSWAPA